MKIKQFGMYFNMLAFKYLSVYICSHVPMYVYEYVQVEKFRKHFI